MPRDLPEPYRSPWGRLGEDLKAVVADGRLSLQRLWRLNREGALPFPAFWPLPLASWFWPLLLVLVPAAVIGAVLAWVPRTAQPDGPVSRQPPVAGYPAPVESVAEPESLVESILPVRPEVIETPSPSAAATELAPAPPLPDERCLEPFDAETLVLPDPRGLIIQACITAPTPILVLQLSASPEPAEADSWLAAAGAGGYEWIDLRSDNGALLGRQALIGEGMILGNL